LLSQVIKNGGGDLNLTGPNSYGGPTFVDAGVLLADNNTLPPNSAFILAPNTVLYWSGVNTIGSLAGSGTVFYGGPNSILNIGSDNSSTTFSGRLDVYSGSEIRKIGIGTLTLDTSFQMPFGTVSVNGGILVVNGTAGPNTQFNVNGGTLGGTGTIGRTSVNSGGTVSPGATGAGALQTGPVYFLSGSTYQVQLNGTAPGSYGQLNSTAFVDLGGSPTLNLSVGFPSTDGDVFTILTASAGVYGMFAGLPDGSVFAAPNGMRFQINYFGTSVQLTHVANPADHLSINAPATVIPGVPFDMTVSALDPSNNVDPLYTHTVTFGTSDSDPGVVLPADYPFTSSDAGTHTFTNTGLGETTLQTCGPQTIMVTDIQSSFTALVNVTVACGAAPGGDAALKSAQVPPLLAIAPQSQTVVLSSNSVPNAGQPEPAWQRQVEQLFTAIGKKETQAPAPHLAPSATQLRWNAAPTWHSLGADAELPLA
jgi:autotransporter-associated beta strand protein